MEPLPGLRAVSRRRSLVSTALALSGLVASGLIAGCDRMPPNPDRPPGACRISGEAPTQPALKLTKVLTGQLIPSPIELMGAPGAGQRVYITGQYGRIYYADEITPGGSVREFLNIAARLEAGGEKGLLGLAFEPGFAQSGRFYVNYTRRMAGQLQTVVSRFRVPSPPLGVADAGSEQVLLVVNQPYDNHNGGQLAFGPDGYLYVALGDGGSAGDPQGNGQNLSSLLGKVLRIDVVSTSDASYRVPADNPFVGQAGKRAEIWTYGMRNPWRLSFDPLTGALWTGDVGQGAREEIDILVRGGNYGWKITEGNLCYEPMTGCDKTGLIPPVYDYPRGDGVSVTGGFVYRGRALPDLYGTYIFGDYATGAIWGLRQGDGNKYERITLIPAARQNWLSGFGRDSDGELYVMDLPGNAIYRLERESAAVALGPSLPLKLSETGCFSDLSTRRFTEGIVSYSVNTPLWSDGAEKERGLSLPPGAAMAYKPDGPFELPVGSVLIKTFLLAGRPVETRLLLRGTDQWRGITYRWNAAGTDADLLTSELTETIAGQTWYFPSRSDCMACHTLVSGQLLGINARQLNRQHELLGGGQPVAQLDELTRLGYLEGAPAPQSELPRFPAVTDETASVGARARAYLDVNCAHCHRPGGIANATQDLRHGVKLADTLACGKPAMQGDLGVPGAQIVAPGTPAKSTLLLRMERLDRTVRMPNLASSAIDMDAVALLRRWIGSLPATCVDPDTEM